MLFKTYTDTKTNIKRIYKWYNESLKSILLRFNKESVYVANYLLKHVYDSKNVLRYSVKCASKVMSHSMQCRTAYIYCKLAIILKFRVDLEIYAMLIVN